MASSLNADSGLAPMSSLGVVSEHIPLVLCPSSCPQIGASIARGGRLSIPDCVASSETDPLWDRTILLLGFGKLELGAERLVRLSQSLVSNVIMQQSRAFPFVPAS